MISPSPAPMRWIQAEDTTSLTYTPQGLLSVHTDSAGTVNYGYNAAGDLTSVAEPGGSCSGQTFNNPGAASTKCILFNLDEDGDRIATRYPGGQKLIYTLDDDARPIRIEGKTSSNNGSSFTTRMDLALTYTDPSAAATGSNPNKDTALITSITDAVASRKTAYSYDHLDRLAVANTTPTAGGSSTDYEAFCYDGAGNRTKYYTAADATCSSSNPAVAYTYDGANAMTNAVAGSGAPMLTGSGFSYDANGSQTSAKSFPGRTVTYSDRGAAINTTPAGGSTEASTYASGGNLERLTAGATNFRPSVLNPAPASSSINGTTIWTVRDPSGEILAIRVGASNSPSAATSYYVFTDQIESVRHLVKSDGTLANSYSYTAYGVTKSATESVANPYRYGAGYTENQSGLIKLGMRYYDPNSGRFTQADPTGQEDNDYVYADDNPVTLNDPNGDLAPLVVFALVWGVRLAVSAPRFAAATRAGAPAAERIRRTVTSQRAAVRAQREIKQRLEQKGYECRTRGGCGIGDYAHVEYKRPNATVWRTVHIGPKNARSRR